MEKELQEVEKGSEAIIQLECRKQHWKKYLTGKRQVLTACMNLGFKKFESIHERLALEQSRCLEEINIPEWMTIGKTTLIYEDPLKGNCPANINW